MAVDSMGHFVSRSNSQRLVPACATAVVEPIAWWICLGLAIFGSPDFASDLGFLWYCCGVVGCRACAPSRTIAPVVGDCGAHRVLASRSFQGCF